MQQKHRPTTTKTNDTADLAQRVVGETPQGTNLGLYHGIMTIARGELLASRGAIIPGLSATGLSRGAVNRSWKAIAHGAWSANGLLKKLKREIREDGKFEPLKVAGYEVKAMDTLGYMRPRLKGCTSKHYVSTAGKALPAICFGVRGVVGSVGEQRVTVLEHIVRAEGDDQSDERLMKRLIKAINTEDFEEAGSPAIDTADRKFSPMDMLRGGSKHIALRRPKNLTMQRAQAPVYKGVGRPPSQGEIIRPLARSYKGQSLPASAPDGTQEWKHTEADGSVVTLSARIWHNTRLIPQKTWTPDDRLLNQQHTWSVAAIKHPNFENPVLMIFNLDLTPEDAYRVFKARWGIEQPPLVAKQLLGAHRQFVHNPEMCFRLPELTLITAAIVTYSAACQPPFPTGVWDRSPKPTAGRLRRHLAHFDFVNTPVQLKLRKKNSATQHLPTGYHPAMAKFKHPPPHLSGN